MSDDSALESIQPHQEREFSAELAAKVPAWMADVGFSMRYRQKQVRRIADLVANTAGHAGATPEDVLTAATDSSSRFSDLLPPVAERAQTAGGDGFYLDALSRLLAAALIDDAKVDVVALMIEKILTLRPIDVRVLTLAPYVDVAHAASQGHLIAVREATRAHGEADERIGHFSARWQEENRHKVSWMERVPFHHWRREDEETINDFFTNSDAACNLRLASVGFEVVLDIPDYVYDISVSALADVGLLNHFTDSDENRPETRMTAFGRAAAMLLNDKDKGLREVRSASNWSS